MKFIMMVGIAGSGKSTLAAKIAERIGDNAKVFSSDDLREEWFGDRRVQGNPRLIFAELHKRMSRHLMNGNTVIMDATNLSSARRMSTVRDMRRIAPEATFIVIEVNTATDLCIARRTEDGLVPSSVIRRQAHQSDPINGAEGWDLMVLVDTTKYINQIDNEVEDALRAIKDYDDANFDCALSVS